MTLQKFFEKYNGKFVEVGGSDNAKNQCVDLVNAFIEEVLGLSKILWTNAKDFPKKAGSNFDFIKNTPNGVPQEGDLVVWDGKYGHIAIFIEGNIHSFRSFDQNSPLGTHAHVQNHNYNNVLGWLRPKGNTMSNMYRGYDLANPESMKPMVDLAKDVIDSKYKKREEFVVLEKKLKENDRVWAERVNNEKKPFKELITELASKEYLNCPQQMPAILQQITQIIQENDTVATELNPKIKRLEEKDARIARILGVKPEKIEETIKKLLEDKEVVTVSEHSKICQLLAKRGL